MINIDFISPTGGIVKSVNGMTGKVVLTAEDVGAATEEYVVQKIAEAELEGKDVDLSAYYTKTETDKAIKAAQPDLTPYAKKTEIPSTAGLATEKYVDDAVANIDIPEVDMTGYATESFVTQKIAEAELGGEDVDLSGYYTKTETDKAIEDAIKDIDIPESDMSAYAKTADLATVATSGSYNDLKDLPSGSISVGSEPGEGADIWIDTSGGDAIDFADVAFTGSYTNLKDTPDLSVYQTAAQVKAIVDAELGVIENGTY